MVVEQDSLTEIAQNENTEMSLCMEVVYINIYMILGDFAKFLYQNWNQNQNWAPVIVLSTLANSEETAWDQNDWSRLSWIKRMSLKLALKDLALLRFNTSTIACNLVMWLTACNSNLSACMHYSSSWAFQFSPSTWTSAWTPTSAHTRLCGWDASCS